MIAAGVLLLLFAAYQLWGTGFHTDRAQTTLKSDFDQQLARVANNQTPIARAPSAADGGGDDPTAGLGGSTTTGTRRPTTTRAPGDTTPPGPGDATDPNLGAATDFRFAKGDAIGEITIPKIGADFTIIEGVDLPFLTEGPGHFPGTSLPGQPGNAALAGHRVTYKAPFNRIDELSPGDTIQVKTVQGTFTYQVMPQAGGVGYFIIDPSDTSIIDDKGDNRLTLMACHPKYDLKQRIVVTAKLVSTPADTSLKGSADKPTLPNPDGSDFTGSGDGVLLGNDSSARLPAILLSLAALAVWLVAWLIARRVHGKLHWVVYLAASPVFLVILLVRVRLHQPIAPRSVLMRGHHPEPRRRVPSRVRRTALAATLGVVVVATSCSGATDTATSTTTATTVAPTTTTTTELPLTAGRQVSFYTPSAGECFDRRKPDPKKPDEIILLLDCNLPHSNEVVGVVDVAEKDYPGEDNLQSQGKAACPKLFKAYVGAAYEVSIYELGYYTPSQTSWGQGVHHVIGCYAYDAKGTKLTSTVKGSNK